MSRRKNQTEEGNAETDMTPMLDIVFILLIFFIVTTSFMRDEGLLVNRPKVNKPSSENKPTMVIRINNTGNISFNNKMVDIERLPARIESFLSKNDSNSVIVIPHYDTMHQDVVSVIDQVKSFNNLTVSIGK